MLSQEVPMRQSKFTETQIVSILKEADAGRPVNEIWRHYGISSATYYKWKAKYGGLEVVTHLVTINGLPVQRACRAVGLNRATYYRPLVDWGRRDAPVIAALTTLVAAKSRWGFWKCCDGYGTSAIRGTLS